MIDVEWFCESSLDSTNSAFSPRLPDSASFLTTTVKEVTRYWLPQMFIILDGVVGAMIYFFSKSSLHEARQNLHILISAKQKYWLCISTQLPSSKHKTCVISSISRGAKDWDRPNLRKVGSSYTLPMRKGKSNFLRRRINFLPPCRIMLMARCSRRACSCQFGEVQPSGRGVDTVFSFTTLKPTFSMPKYLH